MILIPPVSRIKFGTPVTRRRGYFLGSYPARSALQPLLPTGIPSPEEIAIKHRIDEIYTVFPETLLSFVIGLFYIKEYYLSLLNDLSHFY